MDRFVWVCASEEHCVFSDALETHATTCGAFMSSADGWVSLCVCFAVGVDEISLKRFLRWHTHRSCQLLALSCLVSLTLYLTPLRRGARRVVLLWIIASLSLLGVCWESLKSNTTRLCVCDPEHIYSHASDWSLNSERILSKTLRYSR